MSFATEVKNELCRVPLSGHAAPLAEAYGVLLYCHTFTTREIRIVTGVRRLCRAAAEAVPARIRRAILCSRSRKRPADAMCDHHRPRCHRDGVRRLRRGSVAHGRAPHQPRRAGERLRRASFLRGAFLAGGSVTDPSKNYHLELITAHASVSREAAALLHGAGLCRAQHRPRRQHRALF